MSEGTRAVAEAGALRLSLEVWHPGCWVLETTRRTDVGLLSYGCYTRRDGSTTTLFTVYADTTAAIEGACEVIDEHPAVSDVAEIVRDYGRQLPRAGNTARDLLVDHDGTTQISKEFTDRGFVPAEPVDARADTEHWTVLTHHDRDAVEPLLAEIRRERDARIAVTGIANAPRSGDTTPLPVDRLSSRQREVLRCAQAHGYYDHPRRSDAGELAAALGVSTSTIHEHLRKVEAKLLGSDG